MGGNLVVHALCYLNTSEIWSDKKGCLYKTL